MHERGLHIHAQQHTEPDQVDAQLVGNGADQRNYDEGQLEIVEEERQHEDDQVDDDQEAKLPARKVGEQVFDPDMAVDSIEGEAENARAYENEDDEGGDLRR